LAGRAGQVAIMTAIQRRVKVSAAWPWAHAIVTAWDRISALAQSSLTSTPGHHIDQERNPEPVMPPATRPASPATVTSGP
jgi:hypothetical protein